MQLNKFLLLSAIWIGSSCAAYTQAIDTICLPVVQAKKVYGDALKYRYTDSLLKLSELQLAEKKEQVRLLEEQGAEVSSNHRKEITNLENQVGVLKDQVNGFERMWKRQKKRSKIYAASGVVVTLATIIISNLK